MKKLQLSKGQLTSLFPIYENKDFTKTCFLGNFLNDHKDDESLNVMIDDNYLLIIEDHGEIHLHGFLKNTKGATEEIKLNRTGYLWLPPAYQAFDTPSSQLFTLVKYDHFFKERLQTNAELTPEDINKIIRLHSKELFHDAFMKKIYSAIYNNNYFAYSDGSSLRFIQVFNTSANSYNGLFLWSDLFFGETFRFFQMTQGGDYQFFRAWVRSDNSASLALHYLSGYKKQDVEACLFKISQR